VVIFKFEFRVRRRAKPRGCRQAQFAGTLWNERLELTSPQDFGFVSVNPRHLEALEKKAIDVDFGTGETSNVPMKKDSLVTCAPPSTISIQSRPAVTVLPVRFVNTFADARVLPAAEKSRSLSLSLTPRVIGPAVLWY